MRYPSIISHRGKHDAAPENSVAAIQAAILAGADAIEIDVHGTRDNVVVVHHDLFLAPAGGYGGHTPTPRYIADLTANDLRAHRLLDGSTIPTLDEVLSLATGKVHVHVEVKARNIEQAVIDSLLRSDCSTSIHSFDHRIMMRCAELDPSLRLGILLESYLVDTLHALRGAGALDLWQRYELIDADLVRETHSAGGELIAWTVNDPGHAIELARLGVDGICTDDVTLIRNALKEA